MLRLKEPVEIFYLSLMSRWEETAPRDGHQGSLDGEPARNSQISRFAYVVMKIAVGNVEHTLQSLERNTRKNDGRSYISRDSSWMEEPYPLWDGWYFEGCCSLKQKKDFLGHLVSLGLTRSFVECARDFVEGKSVKSYYPTPEEENEILERVRKWEERSNA